MPELPDVELFKKKAEKALNHKIKDVRIDSKKIVKTPQQTLKTNLINKQFTSLKRHGKYLFLKINKKYLMLHFGMTGDISYWKKDKPQYTAINIKLGNNYNLSVISKRKLGKISLVETPEEVINNLGEDALSIKKEDFVNIIKKSRGQLKTTLMDQNKIAGIGNMYADEILYQAGLHPKKKAKRLKESEIEKLYQEMNSVLKTAVEHNANPEEFPSDYIMPYRKEKKFKGKTIKKIKVNGRATYYVPEVQK